MSLNFIEARALVARDATGFSATDRHTTCSRCGRTNHSSDDKKKYPELMAKQALPGNRYDKKKEAKSLFKKFHKSEDANAAVH